MPYGTLSIDAISTSGNLAVTGNVAITGNVTVSGNITANGVITGSAGDIYPLVISTEKNSTSGTSVDFSNIPSWVKRVTLMFEGVSTSGSSNYLIQIGDASGISTTGYVSAGSTINTTVASSSSTAGFIIRISAADGAGTIMTGSLVLTHWGGNKWICHGLMSAGTSTPSTMTTTGSKTLTSALTTVRATTVNGSDTWDLGKINILYE